MKKITRILSLILCLCLSLPLAACTNAGPANSSVATTVVSTAAVTTTVATTAATTSTPSIPQPEPWVADAAAMEKAETLAPKNQLMLGAWVSPRPHWMTTQEEADARYAELKASGINMIYTFYENADRAHLDRILKAAEKNGIQVMVDLSPSDSEANVAANLEVVNFTKDYPAVIGYCMQDEPSAALFPILYDQFTKIRAAVGEDKLIMCNLFPNYASNSQLGTASEGGLSAYQNYLESFLFTTKSDVLSFDYYPFYTSSSKDAVQISGMLQNFSDIVAWGRKYNVPTWGFVQNAAYSGRRMPNINELRFLSHFHLIFGLESYSYFLYAQPSTAGASAGGFDGMMTYDGKQTANYNVVKANNQALSGLQGRYLDYTLKGFYTAALKESYSEDISAELKLNSWGALQSATGTKDLLVGYFENDRGEQAYYVFNFNYKANNTVTITFDSIADYTLWGATGIEQMGGQKTVTLTLLPGEGKFLEMKTFTES